MSLKQIEDSKQKVKNALIALQVAIKKPMDPDRTNIDATIQRFEFTIELFWKLLRQVLSSRGVDVYYPKDVLRKAYAGKLIDNEQMWLAMLNDRNITSHTYDEQQANSIYDHIKNYAPFLQQSFHDLEQRLDKQ